MSHIAWAPLWLATTVYSYVVVALASRPFAMTLRCSAGVIAACAAYGLVMLSTVMLWSPSHGESATVYAYGMAIGTLAGSVMAGVAFPRRYREVGVAICLCLNFAYPMLLSATSEPDAPVQAMQSLYLLATAIGGGGGVTLVSWIDPAG